MAADSLIKASIHEPVGRPGGPGLWGHKTWQLPAYIQHIANDLREKRGMTESRAIQVAIGVVKRWARGGGNVDANTRAAAVKALAEWEALKLKAHASHLSNDGGAVSVDLANDPGALFDAMCKRYGGMSPDKQAKMKPMLTALAKKLGRQKELPKDLQPATASMSNAAGQPIDLAAFTADQRKALAAKGQAMKGGGFPIPNTSYLSKAIHAYGRAKNKTATRAHIKKRAKALGASHMLPSSWQSRSASMSNEQLQAVIDLANTNPRIKKVLVKRIKQRRLRTPRKPVRIKRINPMPKGTRK